jgi:WD40 repeat protein
VWHTYCRFTHLTLRSVLSTACIASGGWDGALRLWDAITGEPTANLTHPGIVWCLAFS